MSGVIYGPADVVTAVNKYLRAKGFDAAVRLPLDRRAGTVRAVRVSGYPLNPRQESTQILLEVWGDSVKQSFMLARRLWVHFALIDREKQDEIDGLTVYSVEPSALIEFPDPDAPTLSRHQLTLSMVIGFEPIRLDD